MGIDVGTTSTSNKLEKKPISWVNLAVGGGKDELGFSFLFLLLLPFIIKKIDRSVINKFTTVFRQQPLVNKSSKNFNVC
jgi:hypothetical protein